MDRPVVALMVFSINELVDLLNSTPLIPNLDEIIEPGDEKELDGSRKFPNEFTDSFSYISDARLLDFKNEPGISL